MNTNNPTDQTEFVKHYRIPTSLSIAVARLRAVMPSAMLGDTYQYGAQTIVAHFRFSNSDSPPLVHFLTGDYPDDEAHTLEVRPLRWLAWRGPWQVIVERESMRWLYAGVKVAVGTLRRGGMRAEGGSAAQQARALTAVGRRLPGLQQSIPADLWGWRLACRVVAATPAEVHVLIDARGRLIEAWQRADAFIRSFWPQAAPVTDDSLAQILKRNRGGRPRDPDTEQVLAFMNAGMTKAEAIDAVLRQKYGDPDTATRLTESRRINDTLRKRKKRLRTN